MQTTSPMQVGRKYFFCASSVSVEKLAEKKNWSRKKFTESTQLFYYQ